MPYGINSNSNARERMNCFRCQAPRIWAVRSPENWACIEFELTSHKFKNSRSKSQKFTNSRSKSRKFKRIFHNPWKHISNILTKCFDRIQENMIQGKQLTWNVLKCFEMFWNVARCLEMFWSTDANLSTSKPAREVMKWNFSIGNIQNTIFNSQRSKLKCSKMF